MSVTIREYTEEYLYLIETEQGNYEVKAETFYNASKKVKETDQSELRKCVKVYPNGHRTTLIDNTKESYQ